MRLKTMPCIKPFISSTKQGNRNSNLFKAINHIRFHNPKANKEVLYKVSLELNKCLDVPVSASEIQQLVTHCLKQPYHTSCKHFKEHCQKCTIGYKKPKWRNEKGYWKLLNKNNCLKIKGSIPLHSEIYLWDIVDLDKLTDEQKKIVMKQREEKGIDPYIDSIIKEYGYPIDEDALDEFLKHKKMEVRI